MKSVIDYKNFCRTIQVMMIILLFPMINIISQTYLTYTHIKDLNDDYKNKIEQIEDLKWSFISNIAKENREKALIQANSVKQKIEDRLLSEYSNNLEQLKIDLESDTDSKAFKIMNEEISGKYLNVKNDNNDMFIATSKKIIVDRSINTAIGKTTRNWEDEIKTHYNSKLAEAAVRLIVTQSSTPIFWQTLSHTSNIIILNENTYINLSSPSIEGLKKVYNMYGVEGLRTYEFLVPTYIKQNSDIFDVDDVGMHGIKNNNLKLIVVQGFNLVDVLEKDYMANLSQFSHLKELELIRLKHEKTRYFIELFMTLSLLIASFIGIFLIAKIIIKWGGDDAIRGCSKG